ncbi:hypothetical protein ACTWQB_01930 [Piscibacillus sp. B03]|uniref:hypothetical protein n=1 Tax=Piscibacillus sp. B03 TaxID=3457430 RepID=UPI003FCCB79B
MSNNYYSYRNGIINNYHRLGLNDLIGYFQKIYFKYFEMNAFNNFFSEIGDEFELYFIENFGKPALLPFNSNNNYSEDDIFDLIELLYEKIGYSLDYFYNKPRIVEKNGKKLNKFDIDFEIYNQYKEANFNIKESFRKEVNRVLKLYQEGFYLSDSGELRRKPINEMDSLIDNEIEVSESNDRDKVNADKVELAKSYFFKRDATDRDKKYALIILGEVLENNRKDVKRKLTSSDEKDLFEILNGYNIRHSDFKQKDNYPSEIYYEWMFYLLLSSVNAYYKIRNYYKDN